MLFPTLVPSVLKFIKLEPNVPVPELLPAVTLIRPFPSGFVDSILISPPPAPSPEYIRLVSKLPTCIYVPATICIGAVKALVDEIV